MTRPQFQAILLVDGYNIIGACPRLQAVRDRHGLEPARRDLVEGLTGYSAIQAYDTRVVFDAYAQPDLGTQDIVTPYLSVCYTSHGQTADAYIEITCAKFRNDVRKFEQRLIVATSDQAQRLTAQGYGAEWMSAHRLVTDVAVAKQQVKRRQRPATQSKQRFLFSSLDPQAQARLTQLRFGLDASES